MAHKQPYIIIGMHRSGTSLVAKVLEKAGIFMGVIKDHNYEAMHFLSLNQQTLWAAGASWLDPKVPAQEFYRTIPEHELYREHFRLNTSFQKLANSLKKPDWGWKDPRNTFTLAMWLEMFPQAKVIHVFRNGEEVAKSLRKRNNKPGEVHDSRLNDMEFNLALWDKYLQQARSFQGLGHRFLEINYADIVSGNAEAIGKLEKFCNRKLVGLFAKYVR